MFSSRKMPFVIAGGLLLLSFLLFGGLLRQEQKRIYEINRLHLQKQVSELVYILDRFTVSFNRMARRWEAGAYDNTKIWDRDVRNYHQDTRGLRAINFVDENYVIKSTYPFEGNEKNLNYNLKSIPHARVALDKALENGVVATTSLINLIAGGRGFVLYFPVFRDGENKGFVSAVFDIDRFFKKNDYFVNYQAVLTSSGKDKFEISNYQPSEISSYEFTLSEKTQFGDVWTFHFKPTKRLIESQSSYLPYIVLLVSLLVVGLVFYISILYFEVREQESVVRELLSWQHSVIDRSSMMFVSVDEKGLIKSINSSVTHSLGYTEYDLLGKVTPEIWHVPAESKAHRSYIEHKYGVQLEHDFDSFLYESRIGVKNKNEFTLIAKSGRPVVVLLEVHCVRDDRNKVKGYVGILEDITVRKDQEKLLKEQEVRVITSTRLAALGEMAAGVGHEINNPLAIISANLAVIKRKGDFPPELMERIEKIESTTHRIAAIVRGLRSLSRQGNSNEVPEKAKVLDIVMDAVYICSERFKSHNIPLKIDPIPEDWMLECFPYQLSQVVLNLLSNSYDAIRNHETEKWMRISIEKTDKSYIFRVIDSGKGLPADVRNKLFQPFFTTKEVGKGLGLGLSISDSIAKRHGGRLYVDANNPNTCFALEIPAVANL